MSGKKALFVNPQFTLFIKGMEERESRTLLRHTIPRDKRARTSIQKIPLATRHGGVLGQLIDPTRGCARLLPAAPSNGSRATIKGTRPMGTGEVAKVAELRKFKMPPLMSLKDRAVRQHEKS